MHEVNDILIIFLCKNIAYYVIGAGELHQDKIVIWLKIVNLECDKISVTVLEPHDLTLTQYKVLKFLLQNPEGTVRQVDIVDRLKAMGVHITKQRLFRVLTNPFYTGWIVHEWVEGGRIMGHHEVLIDEATFNLANGISRRGYEQRETTDEYPLKRHVRCADCGGFLTGYEVKKKHIHYYKCNKKGCCCNYSAKYLHQKYMELLEHYMISEDKIADVSADLMEIFTAINKSKNERCNQLKSEIAEIEKKKSGVKYKYGVGEIEKDIYIETISQLTLEQSEIEEKLVLVSDKLSNLPRTVPRLLLIFCKLASLWNGGDYGFRQKLQNLLFPHGVCFDKKTGNYRTSDVNILARLIASISMDYRDLYKKRDCDFHQQSRLVEYELDLSNEYVAAYHQFSRFINDNIAYLDGFVPSTI